MILVFANVIDVINISPNKAPPSVDIITLLIYSIKVNKFKGDYSNAKLLY